jgi:hypothetical protein
LYLIPSTSQVCTFVIRIDSLLFLMPGEAEHTPLS